VITDFADYSMEGGETQGVPKGSKIFISQYVENSIIRESIYEGSETTAFELLPQLRLRFGRRGGGRAEMERYANGEDLGGVVPFNAAKAERRQIVFELSKDRPLRGHKISGSRDEIHSWTDGRAGRGPV
jgi:hypothetical protein